VTDFYSRGADGVDCWAALIVLGLRKENPALRLHCILPFEGQADKWNQSAQERYHGKVIILDPISLTLTYA